MTYQNLNSYKLKTITTAKRTKNKKTLLWQKSRNDKKLKIKFQQRRVKLKCSIDKRTILLQFFAFFSNKIFLLESNLSTYNNFSEENCLDKPVFNNVSRLELEQYCYKQNQTLPSIIRFRLKMKVALLSWLFFLINDYHQTRYIPF